MTRRTVADQLEAARVACCRLVEAVRRSAWETFTRGAYWPDHAHDPAVRAACHRLHPGDYCRPGDNHPAAS
jgi:hypothetical protein